MAATFEVDIIARFAKFTDAISKVGKEVEGLKGSFEKSFKFVEKAAGFFGIALGVKEFAEAVQESIHLMDELGRASERTGIAIEDLSKLRVAAVLDGTDFEALVAGVDKFNKAIDEGAGAFRRIGLDPKTFKDTNDGLLQFAKRMSEIQAGAGKVDIAVALLGKRGAELIPFFSQGAEKIQAAFDAAQKLNGIVRPEDVKRAEEFERALHEIKLAFEGMTRALAQSLLPMLAKLGAILKAIEDSPLLTRALSVAVGIDVPLSDLDEAKQKSEELAESLAKLEKQLENVRRLMRGERAGSFGPLANQNQLQAQAENLQKQIDARKEQLAQAQAAVKRVQEEANKKPQEKAPDRFIPETAESKAKRIAAIALLKQFAQEEQQIDDIKFARAELSFDEFWQRRLARTQQNLRAELAEIEKNLAKQQEALAKNLGGPAEQDPIKASIAELKGKRDQLKDALRFAPVISTAQSTQQLDALKESIDAIEVSLLRETGRAQDAAEAEGNLLSITQRRLLIAGKFGEDSRELKIFDRQRQNLVLQGELSDQVKEQAATTGELNAREQEATNTFLKSNQALADQLKLLNDISRIRADGIEQQSQELDREEKIIERLTEAGSAERNFLLASLRQRRAQLDQTKAQITPQNLASSEFQHLDSDTQRKLQAEQLREEEIQNRLIAGQITTQEALRQTDEERQKTVATLQKQLEKEQALAKESGKEDDILQAQRTEAALKRLAATSNQVGAQVRGIFEDAFVEPFEDLIKRTKSADEAIKAFFNNIAQSFLHLISKNLSEKLFASLFGTGKSGGGGVDILGSVFRLFSGGGGGAGAGTTTVSASNRMALGGVMTEYGPVQLHRYATGGIARQPQLAMFGEGRGPEAFVPLPDGRSIPVSLKGFDRSQVMPAVQPTLAQTQRGPKGQQGNSSAVVLQIHPDAMHMTLRDWFEGEMARQAATR